MRDSGTESDTQGEIESDTGRGAAGAMDRGMGGVTRPAVAGGPAARTPALPRPNRYECLLAEGSGDAAGDRLARALAAASRRARAEGPLAGRAAAIRRIAAGVAAPTLVAYVLWLLIDARDRGIARLYFQSRDGQVLLALADILAPKLGLEHIERRYLYASRQAWNRAMPGGRTERWLWNDTQPGTTLGDVLRRLAVPPDAVAADLAARGCADLDRPLGEGEIAALSDYFASPRFAEAAAEAQAGSRRLLEAYLAQEGVFDAVPKAMVDLGWTGSQHETLCDLLAARGLPPCPCYLFGAEAFDSPWAGQRLGFHFDFGRAGERTAGKQAAGEQGGERAGGASQAGARRWRRRRRPDLAPRDLYVLMEIFCTSDHGTLAGFRRASDAAGGRVLPDLAPGERAVAWGLAELRAGLAAAAAAVEIAPGMSPEAPLGLRPRIDALLAGFWQAPSRDEARAWGAFPWDAGQGHEKGSHPLAEPLGLADLAQAWRPWRLKKREIFWVEGAIATSPPGLSAAIRAAAALGAAGRRLKRAPRRIAGGS